MSILFIIFLSRLTITQGIHQRGEKITANEAEFNVRAHIAFFIVRDQATRDEEEALLFISIHLMKL